MALAAQIKRMWFDRLPVAAYSPQHSQSRYVFFAGRAWGRHPDVIPPRVEFVEACQRLGVNFEGGLQVDSNESILLVPPECRLTRNYTLEEYVRRTSLSAIVFNNPAVHGCLGWKLGEFMALGKAIISLPLRRVMPAPVIHGEHIHFVDGSQGSIGAAIELLLGDAEYRNHLEAGSRRYFEDVFSPQMMWQRVSEAKQ